MWLRLAQWSQRFQTFELIWGTIDAPPLIPFQVSRDKLHRRKNTTNSAPIVHLSSGWNAATPRAYHKYCFVQQKAPGSQSGAQDSFNKPDWLIQDQPVQVYAACSLISGLWLQAGAKKMSFWAEAWWSPEIPQSWWVFSWMNLYSYKASCRPMFPIVITPAKKMQGSQERMYRKSGEVYWKTPL